jgi:hypothetical protein
MRVIDPGHTYALDEIAGDVDDPSRPGSRWLSFVKRVGDAYPGNAPPARHGPTTQEVIRALIDRTKYVDDQRESAHNESAIRALRTALYHLELRAAEERGDRDRFEAAIEAHLARFGFIEHMETCASCGHVACSKHVVAP